MASPTSHPQGCYPQCCNPKRYPEAATLNAATQNAIQRLLPSMLLSTGLRPRGLLPKTCLHPALLPKTCLQLRMLLPSPKPKRLPPQAAVLTHVTHVTAEGGFSDIPPKRLLPLVLQLTKLLPRPPTQKPATQKPTTQKAATLSAATYVTVEGGFSDVQGKPCGFFTTPNFASSVRTWPSGSNITRTGLQQAGMGWGGVRGLKSQGQGCSKVGWSERVGGAVIAGRQGVRIQEPPEDKPAWKGKQA